MRAPAISILVVVILLGAAAAGWAAGAAGQPARPRAARAARSRIIYPPQRIALRMDHSHPAHRGLACTRCHTEAARSRRAADLLVPEEASCLPCHAEQITRNAQGSGESCDTCHVGFGAEGPNVVPESSFPPPRLRFSHAAHVSRGMACTSCHEMQGTTVATRENLPTMRRCFDCHDGRGDAPSACDTCHVTLPDGRLRTHFPEGVMNPPRWLHGMRHDADFIVRHRWVAADQGELCASCHTESDCADCHDGRVRRASVHPNDWLTLHAQQARRDEPRCASCHTTQHFCLECHARVGVSPIAAPNVRAPGRFHPPAGEWIHGASGHGREARRSMSACVSCHVERDCTSCHGALGIGGGISPHPPGFVNSCDRLLEANSRACRTCHGDISRLGEICR